MNSSALISRVAFSLCLAGTLFVAAGCNAVYVSRPIGDRPHVLKPEEWNGIWLGLEQDSGFTVLVTDAENGRLQIAEIERKEGQLILKQQSVFIRESGDWQFVNIRDDADSSERYGWARIKRDGNVAILWGPDVEKFRTLVRNGTLKGTAGEKDNVILEPLSAANLTAITSGELGVVFDWDTPVILRRTGK